MKEWEERKEHELQSALGKPKNFIDTSGQIEGERYFWFPTVGDSMTDGTERSIESGSLVLGRLVEISSVDDMPLHRPVVIIIDDGGKNYCMLKCVCDIKTDSGMFCLHSYNKKYDNYWLPFDCVRFLFVVERVTIP